MRTVAALVAVVALTGGASARAAGAPSWTKVTTATSPAMSDGRVVAWQQAPGRVLITTGAKSSVLTGRPECPGDLVGVGGGYVLLRCPEFYDPFRVIPYDVVQISTGAVSTVTIDQRYWTQNPPPPLDQVGADWVAGSEGVSGVGENAIVLNWRTGAVVRPYDDPFGPRRYLDLSRPSLGRALCSPLRRTRLRTELSQLPHYAPIIVSGRSALSVRYGGLNGNGTLLGQLRLTRCGATHSQSLGQGTWATLSAGVASWIEAPGGAPGRIAHALRLSDHRAWRLRVPIDSGDPFRTPTALVHTSSALYASVLATGQSPAVYNIVRARLPGQRPKRSPEPR